MKGRSSKEDRKASDLQKEIDKHRDIFSSGMPKILSFFEVMVHLAYRNPIQASDDQRRRIKEFLEEVLREAVPITAVEIEQYEDGILEAANGVPSRCGQQFFRLCLIWFNEFTSPMDRQSRSLSQSVRESWLSYDQSEKIIVSCREKTRRKNAKADLARLWKFTHTEY